jgi:hypothetical protein
MKRLRKFRNPVENVKKFFPEICQDWEVSKNAEFYASFKNTNLPWRQNAPKKVITKNAIFNM